MLTKFSVFIFPAVKRGGLKGKELLRLFHNLAEGNQSRHSVGNHSVTSLEDSKCLTRDWAAERDRTPTWTLRILVWTWCCRLFCFWHRLYSLPSWISSLSHYGTLPFAARHTFPLWLQEVQLWERNVTHVPHIALQKIKWSSHVTTLKCSLTVI